MSMKFSDQYLDLYDNPATLSPEELSYFRDTVSLVCSALDISVEIVNRNHEEMGKPHCEALGIFYTADPKDPARDCFISVDNYFIHECYDAKFNGQWLLSGKSLEEVLCHEIAHMTLFRHCKSHNALTQKYLRNVEEFTTSQALKPALNEQILHAAGTRPTTRNKLHNHDQSR